MSILIRFPASNWTKQQYDTVRNGLIEAGDWPAEGCRLHVCFGDEDDIRVSEVWESSTAAPDSSWSAASRPATTRST